MATTIHVRATVLPGGKLEIVSPVKSHPGG